jgi:hypothetical protein
MLELSGLLGLIILILDIWAIVKVVESRATSGMKALWIAVIFLLPVVGLILWFLFGPK